MNNEKAPALMYAFFSDDSDSDVDDDEYKFVELDTSEDDSDCESCYSLDDEEREWLREPENVYKPRMHFSKPIFIRSLTPAQQ